jgi:uncharacterized protein YbjT (DUF2867 family)
LILVTAANGNQGRLLVPKLLAAGHSVRACVHTDTSAAALRDIGVTDVVVGDLSDAAKRDRHHDRFNDAMGGRIHAAPVTVHRQDRHHPRRLKRGQLPAHAVLGPSGGDRRCRHRRSPTS